ncbi:lantibiotic dehydratase [Nonomuraea sp. NPDC001023]|uniref:lantibiotic dehydratase n=1 Tax=unclassified Nonomuraea TaxID=2593643 RepID=UPI003317A21A
MKPLKEHLLVIASMRIQKTGTVSRKAGLVSLQGSFIVRSPVLPAHRYNRTLIDLHQSLENYAERVRDYLVDLAGDALLMEAIQVASPSLARGLLSAREEQSPRRLEQIAIKATKYAIRAARRSTPFGLFAGVTLGSFSDAPLARWGELHRKHVRPDSEWLVPILHSWQRDLLEAVNFSTNSLCHVRGGRYVLPYVFAMSPGAPNGMTRETTIRASKAVTTLLKAARTPATYHELQQELTQVLPHATPIAVHELIANLVTHDFLLTDLQWHQNSHDGLEQLACRTSTHQGGAALAEINQQLEKYASQPVGEGWRELVDTQDAVTRLTSDSRSALQIDLELDVEVALPRSVQREAERVAQALTAMARKSPYAIPPALASYHARFMERYGTHTLVPLTQLLDTHLGLGAPDGYEVPRDTTRAPAPGASIPLAQPNFVLAKALQQAWLDDAREIILDAEFIEAMGEPSNKHPEIETPAYFDLCLELNCESLEQAAAGDFALLLSGVASTPTPGAMLGRFAEHSGATALLRDMLPAPCTLDWVSAQIVYAPARPRQINVSRVPNVLDTVIPLGVPYDESVTALLPDEIAVGATGERLFLWSTKYRSPVFAMLPHMARIDAAPNLARFLAEVSQTWVTAPRRWSWGQFETFPFLPRVRYGRTIISKARWLPDVSLRDRSLSWREWEAALQHWRERWQVPDLVEVGVGDNRLELDLSSALHRSLLRAELQSRDEVVLVEVTPVEQRCWLDGHTAEIVVSVKERRDGSPPIATLVEKPVLRGRPARHPIGGDWLYAKLYSRAESQEELLRDRLPELLAKLGNQVDRWFFIRYVDPDHHVRLRLHGDSADLRREVLPVLSDVMESLWNEGQIVDWSIDNYVPETHRYGGPESVTNAERLFCADSDMVVTQLRSRMHDSLGVRPETLVALNNIRLLTDLDLEWARWAVTRLAPMLSGARLKPELRCEVRILDPRSDWARLKMCDPGARLYDSWLGRADVARRFAVASSTGASPTAVATDLYADTSVIAHSLLHMHANRLIGIDSEAELQSNALLLAAARMLLNRQDEL